MPRVKDLCTRFIVLANVDQLSHMFSGDHKKHFITLNYYFVLHSFPVQQYLAFEVTLFWLAILFSPVYCRNYLL